MGTAWTAVDNEVRRQQILCALEAQARLPRGTVSKLRDGEPIHGATGSPQDVGYVGIAEGDSLSEPLDCCPSPAPWCRRCLRRCGLGADPRDDVTGRLLAG